MPAKIIERKSEREPLLGKSRSEYLSKDDMQTTAVYVLFAATTVLAFSGIAYSFYKQLTKPTYEPRNV